MRHRGRIRRAARGDALLPAGGYGAGAVNPYLAFATMAEMIRDGRLRMSSPRTRSRTIIKAAGKSMIKVASKMGISTLQSYHGAQIFEAIGSAAKSSTNISPGPRRASAASASTRSRARPARVISTRFQIAANLDGELDVGGQYQWRRRGEFHMYNPNTIAKLQHSVRSGNYNLFKQYTARGR